MKYSPEELYRYAKENDLLSDLSLAFACNDFGFQAFPADFSLILRNGVYYLTLPELEEDPSVEREVGPKGDEELDRIYKAFRHSKNSVALMVVVLPGEVTQMHLSAGENGESAEESVVHQTALTFFEIAGIDTHGKLKVTCERASREATQLAKELFVF